MRAEGWEERLRVLDEAVMAFQVARRAAAQIDFGGFGWLRMVRTAVETPVAEAAARIEVGTSEIFRMEQTERGGVIALDTLRRAAEGLGCELVYGLVPKEGSLRERAAAIEAARTKKQAEAHARKLAKEKNKRRDVVKEAWKEKQRQLMMAEWLKQWQDRDSTELLFKKSPKALRETPFWKEQMRRAITKALRKEGIRLRDWALKEGSRD